MALMLRHCAVFACLLIANPCASLAGSIEDLRPLRVTPEPGRGHVLAPDQLQDDEGRAEAGSDLTIVTPGEFEGLIVDPRVETIRPMQIYHESGAAYIAELEMGQGLPSDSDSRSDCVLLENGGPLGPAHAEHEFIRTTGRGAYSHWTFSTLRFSASDNSDPRTNGRNYTFDCTRPVSVHKARVVTSARTTSYKLIATGETVQGRRLVVRNLDPVAAIRTRFRARGAPDLTSRDGMLNSIFKLGMTLESKSIAIWKLLSDQAFNWHPSQADGEVDDPVKFLNVYGYGYCDDFAESFAKLAATAGIPSRVWVLNGHVVAETHYDGRWHMFDPDFAIYYRGSDGHVLGVEELAADPTPIMAAADYLGSSAAMELVRIFSTTEDNFLHPLEEYLPTHRIEPVLQPGDKVAFDLGPARVVRQVLAREKPRPPLAGNGTLTRTITITGEPTEATFAFDWPYVLVGGTYTGEGEVEISSDGLEWTPSRDFEYWLASRQEAPYGFLLRIRNPGRTGTLTVVFQFAPLALPSVEPGTTTFDLEVTPVTGAFPSEWAGVEVTHEWENRWAGSLP